MEFERLRLNAEVLGEVFNKMRGTRAHENRNGVQADILQHNPFTDVSDVRFYEPLLANSHQIKRFPFITYGIILISFLTFIKFRNNVPDLWTNWAFYFASPSLESIKRLFTSFFVHASWAHLLGNLFFVALCSAEAEDASPISDYLLVIFGGHILGVFMQTAFAQPGYLGGASAGVFSLLTYYSIIFPKARMSAFRRLRPGLGTNTNSVYLRMTFPIQFFVASKVIVEVLYSLGSSQGMAHFVHLGGAAMGVLVGLLRKDKA